MRVEYIGWSNPHVISAEISFTDAEIEALTHAAATCGDECGHVNDPTRDGAYNERRHMLQFVERIILGKARIVFTVEDRHDA